MTAEDLRLRRVGERARAIDANIAEAERLLAAVSKRTAVVQGMPRWRYFRRRALLRDSRCEMKAVAGLHEANARLRMENWLDLAIGQIAVHIEDLASHGTISAGKSNLISILAPDAQGETDAT
jgi:hypothetical protein